MTMRFYEQIRLAGPGCAAAAAAAATAPPAPSLACRHYGSLGSAASLLCAQVQRLKQSGQLNYIFGTTYIENG